MIELALVAVSYVAIVALTILAVIGICTAFIKALFFIVWGWK